MRNRGIEFGRRRPPALHRALALSILLLVTPVVGVEIQGAPYAILGKGQSLTNVLKNFAKAQNLPLILKGEFKTRVRTDFGPAAPGVVLDALSRFYNFTWYFDGAELHLYSPEARETRVISLHRIKETELSASLRKLGFWDPRAIWQVGPGGSMVRVMGAPRYIELVGEIARALEVRATDGGIRTVRTFRLKHALAADRTLDFRGGGQQRVPGVATTLRNILRGDPSGGQAAGQTGRTPEPIGKGKPKKGKSSGIDFLLGTGLVATDGEGGEKGEDGDDRGMSEGNGGQSGLGSGYILADPRLNAVIVYDYRARMKLYEELIATLDVPTEQVEIEVTIMDLSVSHLREFGVDWQARGKGGRLLLDRSGGAAGGETEAPAPDLVAGRSYTDAPPVLGTIVENLGQRFLAKVNALHGRGGTRILSRPSVLTMDNELALIDSSETFYVRLEGDDAVDLVPISVGSVLKVRPHIIQHENDEGIARRIFLDVDIEDGANSQARVLEIPMTQRTHINTQATVREGQSLLLGGYYVHSETRQDNKVPVLGDIPGIRWLFRKRSKNENTLVRLFLITPRIHIPDSPPRDIAELPEDIRGYATSVRQQAPISYREKRLQKRRQRAREKAARAADEASTGTEKAVSPPHEDALLAGEQG